MMIVVEDIASMAPRNTLSVRLQPNSRPIPYPANTMTINLTGVADVQRITVTLHNVTDTMSQVLPDTVVNMNMLIGDTNGNRSVNASDIAQTKGQIGMTVTSANFREDVNVSGTITSADTAQVKASVGHSVP